jgi:hypothetical protein
MSKDLYVGVNNEARGVTDIYVGAGGLARKARAAYVGDEEGVARLFFGEAWEEPGVITPDNMTSDNAPPPYRVSALNIWSGSYIYPAFDTTSTDVAGASGSVGLRDTPVLGEWWFQIDLGKARMAHEGRIKNGGVYYGAGPGTRLFPSDFQVLGSNDPDAWNTEFGFDKWNVLGEYTGYVRPSSNMAWAPKFVLDSPGFYRYYRFRVTRVNPAGTNSNACVYFNQIELSAT